MFEIKNHISPNEWEQETVYAVRVDEDGDTMFLIYNSLSEWEWIRASMCSPAD